MRTYPEIDVDGELTKARQWLIDNPRKRKTAQGMTRFINSWLSRASADGPDPPQRGEPMDCGPIDEAEYEAALAAEQTEERS